MFIGLNVEKGIGPRAAPAYARPARCGRYIMDRGGSWDWDDYIEAAATLALDPTVSKVEEDAKAHPAVIVAIADVLCDESTKDQDAHDFEVPRGRKQVLQFEYSGGDLSPTRHDTDPPGTKFLDGIDSIRTFSDLARSIREIRDLDWTWVDFYVGFHFDIASGPQDLQSWSAWEIWNRACYPWKDWVWTRLRD